MRFNACLTNYKSLLSCIFIYIYFANWCRIVFYLKRFLIILFLYTHPSVFKIQSQISIVTLKKHTHKAHKKTLILFANELITSKKIYIHIKKNLKRSEVRKFMLDIDDNNIKGDIKWISDSCRTHSKWDTASKQKIKNIFFSCCMLENAIFLPCLILNRCD